MTKVVLSYNPYWMRTAISIDGTPEEKNSPLSSLCRDGNGPLRLQNWIDPFLKELLKKRDLEMEIEFHGTELDYEDVREAVDRLEEKEKSRFRLQYERPAGGGRNRLAELKTLLEKAKKSPYGEKFKKEDFENKMARVMDPTFWVNVIATMSSGKSTVVNSLLGEDLMPSCNEACTATITRIYDDDNAVGFTARRFKHGKKELDGGKKFTASLEQLEKWNQDKDTAEIEMHGNIPAIHETEAVSLVLVDTPGPNNSCDESHAATMNNEIRKKPLAMVLYVLNATQLGINDDKSLLNQIKKALEEGGKQASDRFIFVLNKIDECMKSIQRDLSRGIDPVKNNIENAMGYLKKNGITNVQIVPVSALLAKQIRMNRNHPDFFNEDEKDDLMHDIKKFNRYEETNMVERARIGNHCREGLRTQLKAAADGNNAEEQALIRSGIPIVEALLEEFLQKYAMSSKLNDALKALLPILQEFKADEKIKDECQKSKDDIDAMLKKIEEAQKSQTRAKKGNNLRKKLKNKKFKLSHDSDEAITDVNGELDKLILNLGETLKSSVSPEEANDAYEEAKKQCKEHIYEVTLLLERALTQESENVREKLKKEYEIFLKDVLHETFPEDIAIEEMSALSMDLPPAEDLIEVKEVKTGEYEVSDSHWWNPFSWGSSHTEDIYEDRVDLSKVRGKLINELRGWVKGNIDKFMEQAEENFEAIKEGLVDVMDRLDEKLDKIESELLSLQKVLGDAKKLKAVQEQKKREQEEMIRWKNGFIKELDAIMAL